MNLIPVLIKYSLHIDKIILKMLTCSLFRRRQSSFPFSFLPHDVLFFRFRFESGSVDILDLVNVMSACYQLNQQKNSEISISVLLTVAQNEINKISRGLSSLHPTGTLYWHSCNGRCSGQKFSFVVLSSIIKKTYLTEVRG